MDKKKTLYAELERAKTNAYSSSEYCNRSGVPCARAIANLLAHNQERGDRCHFSSTENKVTLTYVKGEYRGQSFDVHKDEFLRAIETVFTVEEGGVIRSMSLHSHSEIWAFIIKRLQHKTSKKFRARDPRNENLTGYGSGGSFSQMI
jgi:hypothetical protein